MNNLELSEQEIIRRQSLDELRKMGVEPYPAALYNVNAWSADIKNEFKDDDERRPVSIAGRIMSRRIMGKASFIELMDSKGRIQVYITRDDICPGENINKNSVVIFEGSLTCEKTQELGHPIRITRLKDVLENYLIYNDKLCKNFDLNRYVPQSAYKDFFVEKQTVERFCLDWVTIIN